MKKNIFKIIITLVFLLMFSLTAFAAEEANYGSLKNYDDTEEFLRYSLAYIEDEHQNGGYESYVENNNASSVNTAATASRSISIKNDRILLKSFGQTSTIEFSVKGMSKTDVLWKSDSTAVVKVNSSGKITTVSNGIAQITAMSKDGAVKDTIMVTVIKPMNSDYLITFSPAVTEFFANAMMKFGYVLTDKIYLPTDYLEALYAVTSVNNVLKFEVANVDGFNWYYRIIDGVEILEKINFNHASTTTASNINLQYTQVKKVVDEVAKGAQGMSEFEKALYLNDYITLNTVYTFDHYSVYNLLVNGIGVCEAYSDAFRLLSDAVGLVAIEVESMDMNHEWNMVRIDGKFYHIDVTWNDPLCGFSDQPGYSDREFFLLNDEEIYYLDHYGWSSLLPTSDSTTFSNMPRYPLGEQSFSNNTWYFIENGSLKSTTMYGNNLKVLNQNFYNVNSICVVDDTLFFGDEAGIYSSKLSKLSESNLIYALGTDNDEESIYSLYEYQDKLYYYYCISEDTVQKCLDGISLLKDDAKNLSMGEIKTQVGWYSINFFWQKQIYISGYSVQYYSNGKWNVVTTSYDSTLDTIRLINLTPNTTYKFRVYPFVKNGDKITWCQPTYKTITTKALEVKTISAAIGWYSTILKWDKVDATHGYSVQMYDGKSWKVVKTTYDANDTTATIKNLTPGTKYYFRIFPFAKIDSKIYWGKQNYKTITTKLPEITTIKKAIGWQSVILEWNEASGTSGYCIQTYENGKWVNVKVTYNPKETSIHIKNLKQATTYYYRVFPFMKSGSKIYWGKSSSTKLTTMSTAKPKAMGNITAKVGYYTTILNWNAPIGATGYNVQQYIGNGKWKTVKVTYYGNDTTATITGLKAGSTYYFRIFPFAKNGSQILWGTQSYETVTMKKL